MAIIIAVALLIIGGLIFYVVKLNASIEEEKANVSAQAIADYEKLAALDKQEMENEYQQFSDQYGEMMQRIKNDSIVAQLTREQQRTQQLLAELRNVKSTNAKEIARLKQELATCREVIRSYVIQVDSLSRLNQNLREENTQIRGQFDEATRQIEDLNGKTEALNQRVAIAAQLDATAISMNAQNEKGKAEKKLKKVRAFQINFNIAKNVTAATGNKTVYVRVNTPNGSTLGATGSFSYENRQIQYTAKKGIEYNGQETPVSVYCSAKETLVAGTYKVSIFCDGNMIGSRSFTFQ